MSDSNPTNCYDAVIVGAGFSGLYMLYRLRELGLSARVIEAGSGVGGTWYWNRYPGARCDNESLMYSYSFSEELQQEWSWSSRYARQPEILRYINHVADRFDLRRDIQFETRVTEAIFDEATKGWAIRTDREDHLSATYCIMASGCLSAPRRPGFEGLDAYQGDWYHTGYWPHEGVDFTGKRVAVIGTGSSAIQAIPYIAEQAAHLTVFQRTPNFCIPSWDGPLAPEAERKMKGDYAHYRQLARESEGGDIQYSNPESAVAVSAETLERVFEQRWAEGGFNMQVAFSDLMTDPEANALAAEFCRSKVRSRVDDPTVAELLCPTDHPFGTKRLCQDSDYFETFNRDNVTLVDVKQSPIESLTPGGLRTRDQDYAFDAIVFATGFDAMTGALFGIDIRGRSGAALKDKWLAGPRTYLGLASAGFPNLFTITGPGSPSVLSNMVVALEQHVDWVTNCIDHLRQQGLECIEATLEAEDEWVRHVDEVGHQTLFPQANSWYVGANIPGKPRVFTPYVGGLGNYTKICERVAANGYEGFVLSA